VRPILFAAAALALATASPPAATAAAPASAAAPHDAADPFEKFNRFGFRLEGALDRWIVGPIAHVYRFLTPGPIGAGVHNLVTNLTEPMIAVNGLLQVRPKRAVATVARFALNSTIGLAGLVDVAAKDGLPHRPNSFGDTLGRYGVGPGPYLFFPLAGPSTVRDAFGTIIDIVADPVHLVNYAYRTEVSISSGFVRGVDLRARSEADLEALLSDAADPYATLRSTYLQARQGEIEGEGATPPNLPDLDQPTLVPAPSTTPSPDGQPKPPGPSASVAHPGDWLLASTQEKATTFNPLPYQQGGQANGEFTGALEQR